MGASMTIRKLGERGQGGGGRWELAAEDCEVWSRGEGDGGGWDFFRWPLTLGKRRTKRWDARKEGKGPRLQAAGKRTLVFAKLARPKVKSFKIQIFAHLFRDPFDYDAQAAMKCNRKLIGGKFESFRCARVPSMERGVFGEFRKFSANASEGKNIARSKERQRFKEENA